MKLAHKNHLSLLIATLAIAGTALTGCGKASGSGATDQNLALVGNPSGGGNGGDTTTLCDLKATNTTTGATLTASTAVAGSSITFTVGDSAQFAVTSTPSQLNAFWYGTKNGLIDADHVFAGVTPYTLQGPYDSTQLGTYTRYAQLEDTDGNVVCKSKTISVIIVAAGGTPAATLSTDKVMYRVGDTPLFTIVGAAPNAPIYWSSTLNGVSTGENNIYYGHTTDAQGRFQVYGGTWSASHIGLWSKRAKIGTTTYTVNFQVTN